VARKVIGLKRLVYLIKTQDDLYNKVEAAIKSQHSYETPEICAVPIIKGSKEYLIPSCIHSSTFVVFVIGASTYGTIRLRRLFLAVAVYF
jgi:hypothetical protein